MRGEKSRTCGKAEPKQMHPPSTKHTGATTSSGSSTDFTSASNSYHSDLLTAQAPNDFSSSRHTHRPISIKPFASFVALAVISSSCINSNNGNMKLASAFGSFVTKGSFPITVRSYSSGGAFRNTMMMKAKVGQAEVVLVGCGAPNRGMGWYHAVQMLEGRYGYVNYVVL